MQPELDVVPVRIRWLDHLHSEPKATSGVAGTDNRLYNAVTSGSTVVSSLEALLGQRLNSKGRKQTTKEGILKH